MTSPLELSLCVPEILPASDIEEFYRNVNQFFLKFPLPFEILFAVRSRDVDSRKCLEALAAKDSRVRIIPAKHASRAKTLEFLFRNASGKMIVATSLRPTVPLGEIFKMLQELYTENTLEAVFGNRLHGKKNATASHHVVETATERFFHGIITEKKPWPFQDLFCPTFAIKQSSFQKILPHLRSSGWHWTHEVQRVLTKLNLKAIEVPVFGTPEQVPGALDGPQRMESLRLLVFVIFRI